jgi:predicted metal-dependent phosphoesterase TrpH
MDLHLHTNCSDGRLTPDELIERCAKSGLHYIAITDHDLAPTWPCGRVETSDGHVVNIIHGVELSGAHDGKELHLLVYFAGEMPEKFRSFCRERTLWRVGRYERARVKLGLSGVAEADEKAKAGELSLTRHHMAMALVNSGHVKTIQQAFDEHLGSEHGLFPLVEVNFVDLIKMATEAGGVTSWAHPFPDDANNYMAEFAAAGLHGVEVYRPRRRKSDRKALKLLASKHSLFVTGGSDWHGWRRDSLGSFSMAGDLAVGFINALEGKCA